MSYQDCKVVLLGGTHVGKRSISSRFTTQVFPPPFDPFFGENDRKMSIIDGRTIIFDIFEGVPSPEQDPSPSEIRDYVIKEASVILLVYDVTRRSTLDAVQQCFENIHRVKSLESMPPLVLVGNHSDMPHREVQPDEGRHLAARLQCAGFIETSAKEGTGIDEAFEIAGRALMAVENTNSTILKDR